MEFLHIFFDINTEDSNLFHLKLIVDESCTVCESDLFV